MVSKENCKYMRAKYNYTPNDYDLYFDYSDIPSNINLEDSASLTNRLQGLMPLTKVIHLHLNEMDRNHAQEISVSTALTIKNRKITSEVKFI